ncbi:beta-glucosidase [Nocardioides flavus (ex Wang et al. 2016)]|uniref:Beta-glucosidase n=1 Tax=Nocardioides flavus (ex Wang et al. 2016) TaxID=2058780 RepID=A0ABQ3HMH0_9ACTN|nr:GH1 family beta-glucosidase [Nocardioides flavus (ex Wang et al. 2016)]GHE17926.1 beta-glucosidase [Nocardioides flavus (ex Wang et al. 2016)]
MTAARDPFPLALGVATASYQIEGAVREDGRGPSIWDTFSAEPGRVRGGDDGVDACDSYHRVDDDIALVEGLGVDAYRFSVAWPRVLPEGRGRVETRGLDHYERLVDGLLAAGVEPVATLYHWDLPQVLEDEGGWLARSTAEAFVEYAGVVHERLGDRVTSWATHNEPWCAAYLGYAAGVHAPGRREAGAGHRAAHHLMLGHAWTRRALPGAHLGIVLNLAPVWPESPDAADVADGVDAIRNRVWLDPLVDGAYDERLLAIAPELTDPGLVRPGDLEAMKGSADWIGINYYTPIRPARRADGGEPHPEQGAYPGVEGLDLVVRGPRTDIGWEIEPRGLEELLVETHRRTGLPLVVTENGAACADDQVVDGRVDDTDRIDYLRDHLGAVERARRAGADVRGYFVWTLLDNFEWAEGYAKTFGLVHVDRSSPSLTRTPKASYHWFAEQVAAPARGRGAAGLLSP